MSNLEEEVIVLLNLRGSESGINVRKFGANIEKDVSTSTEVVNDIVTAPVVVASSNQVPNEYEYELEFLIPSAEDTNVYRSNSTPLSNDVIDQEEETEARAETPHQVSGTRVPSKTAKKLLEVQVQQQKEYHKKCINLLEQQNRELRLQTDELKKIRRLKEKKLDMIKKNIIFNEKQTIENTKLKLEEINLKKRKLELQEEELSQKCKRI